MSRGAAAAGRPLPVRAILLTATVAALLALFGVLHLLQAPGDVPLGDALRTIVTPDGTLAQQVVRHVHLPRMVAALLCGTALAAAGVLLQTVTGNGLASPATLGVNAGAYVAAVLAAVVLPPISLLASVGVTFAGGLLAAGLVVAAAGGFRAGPLRLVLSGVAIAMACAAVSSTVQVIYENETAGLYFWGSGTLIQRDWQGVAMLWPMLAVGAAAALLLARPLDVLSLGEDVAQGLGQRVAVVRLGAVIAGVWLAASVVALVGPIGFVGLVAPHLARLLGVRSHLLLLPVAGILGALLLLAADTAALALDPITGGAVPAGIVTGLIGGPWLIGLARTARGGAGRPTAHGRARVGPPSLPRGAVLLIAALVLAVTLGVAAMAGTPWLRPASLMGGATGVEALLVSFRLPRVAVAALAGAALALSGTLYQGVIRNPLAAPETLGTTAGAALGALLLLLAMPQLPPHWAPVGAAAGAVLAFTVTWLLGHRGGGDPARLALIGIAVATVAMSITSLLILRSDLRLAQAIVYLAGSTYARDGGHVLVLVAGLVVLMPLALLCIRPLDVMALGDESARSLGGPLGRWRLAVLALATALTAVAVAMVGTVGFVGLIAPHAARLLVGARHGWLVALAPLLGAAGLVAADALGRTVAAPREIPAGIAMALVGAPYFLWLLRRHAT